jgi:hypothetical protein
MNLSTKVGFNAACANPNLNSLQNTTEDVIKTVRTDGVEAYCSPYICKNSNQSQGAHQCN